MVHSSRGGQGKSDRRIWRFLRRIESRISDLMEKMNRRIRI